MSNKITFINAIASGDSAVANESFSKILRTKVNTALDIKRISITTDIFNKANKKATV